MTQRRQGVTIVLLDILRLFVRPSRIKAGSVITCRFCGAHTVVATTTLPILHTNQCTRGEQ